MQRRKVLILGAAGRDFHDFNVAFRDNAEYEVVSRLNPDATVIEAAMPVVVDDAVGKRRVA